MRQSCNGTNDISDGVDDNNNELPYNPKNKLLGMDDLIFFLKSHDVNELPRDLSLYRKAFLHKSYCTRKNQNFINGNLLCPSDCLPLQEESLERLEFLGDSFLGCIIANYLYDRYPNENEGFLTKMRTKLVNGKMLAHLSRTIGFGKHLIISKQIEDASGRDINDNLEDTFEAFIGAMVKDFSEQGYHIAEKWIINIIETYLDFSALILKNNNFKDTFLKNYQQNYGYQPKFYEINHESRNKYKNDKSSFKLCLKDQENNVIAIGYGNSKKDAENDTCYNALKQQGLI